MTLFENVFVAASNGAGERSDEAYDRCVDALALWHYRGGPWEAAGEFRFDDSA